MRKSASSTDNSAKRLLGQLAAEKKKTVMALCLITVMGFMWVRVLLRRAPESAEAGSATGQLRVEDQSNRESKIFFIELPEVAGRNDVIARDFFASDDWRHFTEGQNLAGIEEVNIVSTGGNEEVIRKVAEKLKLQAIGLGDNPRVVINDQTLSVGDKVLIRGGVDAYEFEVVDIKESTVVVRCREAELTLKLVQVIESSG
jgi:hypothetical protein